MKILIVCLDNIGDLVMSTMLPRALKKRFSKSSIAYLVKEYTKDIVFSNPFVDEVMIFNPSWLSDYLKKHFTFGQIFKLIKDLRLRRFDLSLVVNADWKKALLPYLTRIPERIGHKRKKAGFFLNKAVIYQNSQTRHMMEDNLDLLEVLGIKREENIPEVFSNAQSDKFVYEFIKGKSISSEKRIVGIHPFSLNPARSWEITKFAALCDKLVLEKGVVLFLLIRKGDSRVDKMLKLIHNNQTYVTNDCDLAQMIAFIKECSVFVGNDSGPMHIAAALNVPVVGIFGPSNPVRFGPLGENNIVVKNDLPCAPCSSTPDCKTLECIKSITVDEVYQAVNKLLN